MVQMSYILTELTLQKLKGSPETTNQSSPV